MATIPRTATFAWSPCNDLLVSGTVSGALDATFSNEAQLELWSPFDAQRAVKAAVGVPARFNRLEWGAVDEASRPQGIIAAGMENGELALWDPVKLLDGQGDAAAIFKNNFHKGPVRGLHFNPSSGHHIASGSKDGEIHIWDLGDLQKPYGPGQRSQQLADITALAWNSKVQHVLASASTNGNTVIWDLRGKREVITFSNPQARGGVSAVSWQPDNATRLATASEDDGYPVVMMWDLRNSHAPERLLQGDSGHTKGILNLDWCPRDRDLLVSCGKDCRTLLWNPSTGDRVGELPPASNWNFQAQWSSRNPNAIATASYDGTLNIHTLQSTNQDSNKQPAAADVDIFDSSSVSNRVSEHPLSLIQTPDWYRRPASVSFGFGGKLAIVETPRAASTSSAAPGSAQQHSTHQGSSSVRLQQAVTEPSIVERALSLENSSENASLLDYCAGKVSEYNKNETQKGTGVHDDHATWVLLRSLFGADSKDELISLLGFSKAEIKGKVDEAIRNFKDKPSGLSRTPSQTGLGTKTVAEKRSPSSTSMEVEDGNSTHRESLVTFAQKSGDGASAGDAATARDGIQSELTPSEISTGPISDGTKVAENEVESELTEPSLFGDDRAGVIDGTNATPQPADVDFYDQLRSNRPSALEHISDRSRIASSIAATAGSAPSSVTSEPAKSNTFKIYPSEESDSDRLVTRALVVGDFESAVSLCISSDRFADAILLAVRGGQELLSYAQKAYFDRHIAASPYLRLYQSVVLQDLTDVVQNADLTEWQEIFVVLCTFARAEEFSSLVEQLGQRLEYQFTVTRGTSYSASSNEYRKNAVVCYLAAGKLEKVVNIWIDEMKEDEERLTATDSKAAAPSKYSNRAHALQTFIEKVTVFQSAVGYKDQDLGSAGGAQDDEGHQTFKLASLYDCYLEYTELLASQGLVNLASRYLDQVPPSYRDSTKDSGSVLQSRLQTQKSSRTPQVSSYANTYQTTGVSGIAPAQRGVPTHSFQPTSNLSTGNYDNPYAPSSVPQQAQPTYNAAPSYQPYAPQMVPQPTYAQPPMQVQQPPPPPPPAHHAPKEAALGWNDAPPSSSAMRAVTPSQQRPAPIMSPFPNANPTQQQQGTGGAPPPMPPNRGGARTPSGVNHPQAYPLPQQQAPPVPPPPAMGARGMVSPPQQQPTGPYAPPPGTQQHQGPPPTSPYQRPPPNVAGNYGAPHGGGHMPGPPRPPSSGAVRQQMSPPNGNAPPVPVVPQAYASSQQQQHANQQFASPPGQQPSAPRAPRTPGPYEPAPSQSPPQAAPPLPHQQMPPHQVPAAGVVPPPQPPQQQAPPPKPQPPQPKYPPGDREHIPDGHKPIFHILNHKLNSFRQVAPPQLKRQVDDAVRRLGILFDGLNCGTIDPPVVDLLKNFSKALEARDQNAALQIHLKLLTTSGPSDKQYLPSLKLLATKAGELQ